MGTGSLIARRAPLNSLTSTGESVGVNVAKRFAKDARLGQESVAAKPIKGAGSVLQVVVFVVEVSHLDM